jgi:pyruvate-formate lyase-activating enzyme
MPRLLPVVQRQATRVLPRTLTLNTLTLLVTYRCNYNCDHCVFRSGPHRTEVMDEALARRAIAEAQRLVPTLELVTFSGGEPFLVPDLLRTLHAYAADLDLTCGVVTNAFWARSRQAALAALEPLAEHGLVDFTTSLDVYHLAYAPAERVRVALEAALDLGLRTHLNIVVRSGSDVREANAHEVLGMSKAALQRVTCCEFSPTLVGSAADRLTAADVVTIDDPDALRAACPYVLRSLTITPGGTVHGCCGVGGASDDGPSALLRIGSLLEETLEELHDRMTRNLAFHVIAREGPYALLELGWQTDPALAVRSEFAHICDVCHELTVNELLRGAVRRGLDAIVARHSGRAG